VIEQIKAAVYGAAAKNQKLAMFHFQVLKNADDLAGIDPKNFCKEVSVPGCIRAWRGASQFSQSFQTFLYASAANDRALNSISEVPQTPAFKITGSTQMLAFSRIFFFSAKVLFDNLLFRA
jgi:hypothetical protein